jgi:hypothetical protein
MTSFARLPDPPREYNRDYMQRLINQLNEQFRDMFVDKQLIGAHLHLDKDKLATEADIATLRTGDVYRDSSASNVLKIKP